MLSKVRLGRASVVGVVLVLGVATLLAVAPDTGAKKQEESSQDPWSNFDPLSGKKCQVSAGVAECNRKWVEELKGLESSIADWEALYLYRDVMLYFLRPPEESLLVYQSKGWRITLWGANVLLRRGWLEAFRKEDRTYPTESPEDRERHLKWLMQLRGESSDTTDKMTAKEWLEEFYGEEFYDPPGREPPERPPEGSLEAELEIDHPPKLGENARVTLTIVSHWDFPQVSTGISVGRDRNVDEPPGIEIVSWPEEFEIEGAAMVDECMMSTQLRMNERRVYEFVIKVTSEGVKYIGGGVGEIIPLEGMVAATDDIFLDVGEKKTKVSETPFPPPPEFWLTPLIRDGGPRYYSVETMRKHMDLFLREEPSLTRKEARWLVDKAEYIAMRPSMTSVGFTKLFTAAIDTVIDEAKKMVASEEINKLEAFKAIIENWEKNRPEERFNIPKLLDEEGVPIKDEYETPPTEDLNESPAADSVTVTGRFVYLKHRYTKEQGLLPETDTVPVRKALIWVWESYAGLTYLGKTLTDENGYYDWTGLADGGAPWHKIMVVVHTTGPDYALPHAYKIKVFADSALFPQYPPYPSSPFWRFRTDIDSCLGGGLIDFETWCAGQRYGLYPENKQPRSGAANICDALIGAYEYVTDSMPVSPNYHSCPVIWYPNNPWSTSKYTSRDTIKIAGTMPRIKAWRSTDEWDDDVVIHEYGHFLMDRYAELEHGGSSPNWCEDWGKNHWRAAWQEAWAYLFSSIVRHDSFFVNTRRAIGGGAIHAYYNLENENDFYWPDAPDTMEGGPGCIDAIAASLWDFCDATNESWPDGRQDSIRVEFWRIWSVFDSYDPDTTTNEQDNCWNIYDFWTGWLAWAHPYPLQVKEIFNHHRIGGRYPRGFSATGGDGKVDLEWKSEDLRELTLQSADIFNIYRSDFEFGPYAVMDTTDYVPGETLYTYSDVTVEYAMPYWYKVGAVDSVGFEAESDVDSGIPYNLPSPPVSPAPVTNLAAFDTPYDDGGSITLTWAISTDDSIVTNYYIYRSWFSGSRYDCIDSVGQGVETFIDNRAVDGDTLYYVVRAHNGTNGSSSEEIWAVSKPNPAGLSDTPLATAYNNAQKIAWAEGDSTIYIAYSSGDSVYCEISTNFGTTWSWSGVGEGAFPTIALAPDGDLWMVWLGNYYEDPETFGAYRDILCSRFSVDTWRLPDTIWSYSDYDSLESVSFSTDSVIPTGFGHVAATYMKDNIYVDGSDTIHCIESYLEYFRFALDDSLSNVTRQVVTSASQGAPPPFITLASVTADTLGLPHIAWEQWISWPAFANGILYTFGKDISADTVQWAGSKDTLSDLMVDSYYPYIEYDRYHDRTSVVWDADHEGTTVGFQVYSRFKIDGTWWSMKRVTDAAGDARLPAISGDYAVWSEWAIDGPAQIFKAKYNSDSSAWDPPETVFVSDEASIYPHTVFVQALSDTFLFTCWTEGDSTPYSIAFNVDTVQGAGLMSSYYVDAGRPIPSPYLIHRGGYQDWGGSAQRTVDTDAHKVLYEFTDLDPRASYHLTTVHYFEPPSMADIVGATLVGSTPVSRTAVAGEVGVALVGNVKATDKVNRDIDRGVPHTVLLERSPIQYSIDQSVSVTPVEDLKGTGNVAHKLMQGEELAPVAPAQWVMGIRLDGEPSGEVKFPARSVLTFQCEIPQSSIADGALAVEIRRLAGECALVSELYLSQVEGRDAEAVAAGTQVAGERGRNRFRFHSLRPNPSRGDVRADYEIGSPCHVIVAVFDVAGRLVRSISKARQAPGAHSVIWNLTANPDHLVAGGVYFVRLTAKNIESGRVEFLSTKKLVLVR